MCGRAGEGGFHKRVSTRSFILLNSLGWGETALDKKTVLAAMAIMLTPFLGACDRNGSAHENDEIMRSAAKKMSYSMPENRAFFLVKEGLGHSRTAVVYGYADNESACEQLALALGASANFLTYHCEIIE